MEYRPREAASTVYVYLLEFWNKEATSIVGTALGGYSLKAESGNALRDNFMICIHRCFLIIYSVDKN
jgi:hypothetical protein